MDTRGSSDSSFIDIVSNFLAVLIIVTVLSMLAHRLAEGPVELEPDEAAPTLSMPPTRCELFLPWDRYYYVSEGKIAPLNLDAVSRRLFEHPRILSWQTAEGTWTIDDPATLEASARYDVNTYRIRLSVNAASLLADVEPVDPQTFVIALRNQYETRHHIPTFIVTESGMAVFSDLYPHLNDASLRHRWFPSPSGEEVELFRAADMFATRGHCR